MSTWKALHGPAPNVMFMLRHKPGARGLSDFTKLKGMEITIEGEPFEHLIYHYRLAYSGWQYAQIIQGGESFIDLSEGLQNALMASGGTPEEQLILRWAIACDGPKTTEPQRRATANSSP